MRLFRKLTKKEWKEIGENYKDGGVHMYRGKRTFFYNGEKLFDEDNNEFLNYNYKEKETWEVVIVLPGVQVIPWGTFHYCDNVQVVIMADSVRKIEDEAFFNCDRLAFIKLSRNLEYIGFSAFCCCKSLPSIFIPPSCREIGDWAFKDCAKLIIFVVPPKTLLGKHVIVMTALMHASPIETDEQGSYSRFNNQKDIEVNK